MTAAIASESSWAASRTSPLMTRAPPVAIAPNASSACPGTPSLRTSRTSSGAPSAAATSTPTGTPPRGSASTSGSPGASSSPSASSACTTSGARRRPASTRSANASMVTTLPVRAPRQARSAGRWAPSLACPAMITVAPEVAEALDAGQPVVALESTIVSHGLPRPDNVDIARRIEQAVRDGGAVPATIALVDGEVRVGLDDEALEAIATRDDVVKCSARDLPIAAARGATGATTVAATAHLAAEAGIGLFATGGLGGVHREASETWDESADLVGLSRTDICVVCAGVKSILDIPATLERLETLGIGVAGYRTNKFPAFYLTESGYELPWQLDSPEEIAAGLGARGGAGVGGSGALVPHPLPGGEEPRPPPPPRRRGAGPPPGP